MSDSNAESTSLPFSAGSESDKPKKRRRSSRPDHKVRNRWILAIVIVLLLSVAWLAFSGFMAARAVKSAQADLNGIQTVMTSASAQNQLADPSIKKGLNQASENTGKARFWTSGPVWAVASAVPYVGNTLQAVRTTVAGTDDAVSNALPYMVKAAEISAENDLRRNNGAVNIAAIEQTQAPLARAARAMDSALVLADAAPSSWVLGSVAESIQDANAQLHQLQGQVTNLNTASQVLPTVLGAAGKQTYFVSFTNPTEARAGGGFLGAYGILTAKNGKLTLDKVGSNSELEDFQKPVLNLGQDYKNIYRDNAALWRNMNLSPHFPYAAQQYLAGWKKETGQELDGVLSLDVVTLAYLSEVTGPVELANGKTLQTNEVVDYLTNQIYIDFPTDTEQRDEIQLGVASTLVSTLTNSDGSPLQIAKPFARAASEGRILFYSANPEIEEQLVGLPISGAIDTKLGPYAFMVVNNYGGNKLEYYLDRTLEYSQQSCLSGVASTTVTTTLEYNVPRGKQLPDYIADRLDKGSKNKKRGTTLSSQMVLLPMGSHVKSVRLDGQPAEYSSVKEAGRPGILVFSDMEPRTPVTLTIELDEPASTLQPRIPVQPLIRDQKTVVSWNPCS